MQHWLSSGVGYVSPTQISLKIHEIRSCKRPFTCRFQNFLLQTGVHGKLFHESKMSILVVLSSSPGFSSSTNANDVLSALIRPNHLVTLMWRALPPLKPPQLWCQPGPPSTDTDKVSTFHDSGNYSSPSPSALVPKIASVEDPNAILACQIVAVRQKRDFDSRTWLLLSMQKSYSLMLFSLGEMTAFLVAGLALADCVCRGSLAYRNSCPGLPVTATEGPGQPRTLPWYPGLATVSP